MKIVKINGVEKVLKFNIGVIRRSAKTLGVKTPVLLEMLTQGDMDAGAVFITECVRCLDRKFSIEEIDNLETIDEYVELFGVCMDLFNANMPEASGDESEKK